MRAHNERDHTMKMFQCGRPHYAKVNFVDENGVLVGYDTEQDCCEQAGWAITGEAALPEGEGVSTWERLAEPTANELAGFVFDVDYFTEDRRESKYDDERNSVTFRMTKGGEPDKYLHLYNSHNGYYGHGFELEVGGDKKYCGSI